MSVIAPVEIDDRGTVERCFWEREPNPEKGELVRSSDVSQLGH